MRTRKRVMGKRGGSIITFFKLSEPDDKPPLQPKKTERVSALFFFLAPLLALVGILYLLTFLGD